MAELSDILTPAKGLFFHTHVSCSDKARRTAAARRESRLSRPARVPGVPPNPRRCVARSRAIRAGLRNPQRLRDQAGAVHGRARAHRTSHPANDAHRGPPARAPGAPPTPQRESTSGPSAANQTWAGEAQGRDTTRPRGGERRSRQPDRRRRATHTHLASAPRQSDAISAAPPDRCWASTQPNRLSRRRRAVATPSIVAPREGRPMAFPGIRRLSLSFCAPGSRRLWPWRLIRLVQ